VIIYIYWEHFHVTTWIINANRVAPSKIVFFSALRSNPVCIYEGHKVRTKDHVMFTFLSFLSTNLPLYFGRNPGLPNVDPLFQAWCLFVHGDTCFSGHDRYELPATHLFRCRSLEPAASLTLGLMGARKVYHSITKRQELWLKLLGTQIHTAGCRIFQQILASCARQKGGVEVLLCFRNRVRYGRISLTIDCFQVHLLWLSIVQVSCAWHLGVWFCVGSLYGKHWTWSNSPMGDTACVKPDFIHILRRSMARCENLQKPKLWKRLCPTVSMLIWSWKLDYFSIDTSGPGGSIANDNNDHKWIISYSVNDTNIYQPLIKSISIISSIDSNDRFGQGFPALNCARWHWRLTKDWGWPNTCFIYRVHPDTQRGWSSINGRSSGS
jgi:hypothetical protein